MYVYTYIHNWSLQAFSQDYDLTFHTTYVVWDNFIHKWWELQLKVDSERFFEKLFMAILFTRRLFPEICWEEIAEEILLVFCFDVWLYVFICQMRSENRTFPSFVEFFTIYSTLLSLTNKLLFSYINNNIFIIIITFKDLSSPSFHFFF